MRRAGDLWPAIASFEALRRAGLRAARHKRSSLAAARFLERLEPECLQLERELEAGTWRPSPAATFQIRDPKPRTITAVPFRDRVVHHALFDALEPAFERRMIADSFACRRGKGLHSAVERAQTFTRRYAQCLRMDVAAFFDSLEHDVVLDALARCVKDRRALELAERIVRRPGSSRGLPIGSLSSQWLANLVLDQLDHHVKEHLRVPGYLRYMDDLALFSDDRDGLRRAREEVSTFLSARLRLQPKERATRLAPTHAGLPFLGFLVFPGTLRLRPENRRRSLSKLGRLRWLVARSSISEARYRSGVASILAHVSHADSRRLRQRWFDEHELNL